MTRWATLADVLAVRDRSTTMTNLPTLTDAVVTARRPTRPTGEYCCLSCGTSLVGPLVAQDADGPHMAECWREGDVRPVAWFRFAD